MGENAYKATTATADSISVQKTAPSPKYLGGVYDSDGAYLGDGALAENKAVLVDNKAFTDNTTGGTTTWEKVLADTSKKDLGSHDELVRLAACAYGEGSTKDVYEEMAGIASVIVRQVAARKSTISTLLKDGGTYAFASSGKCERFNTMMKSTPEERDKKPGMKTAMKAGINALSGGTDYSNEAYFWDGLDIKTNYKNHAKIVKGFKFTDTKHNIYSLADNAVEVTTYWDPPKNSKVRGKYSYTYETTAAEGGTIFSKYTDDFLSKTGHTNKYL